MYQPCNPLCRHGAALDVRDGAARGIRPVQPVFVLRRDCRRETPIPAGVHDGDARLARLVPLHPFAGGSCLAAQREGVESFRPKRQQAALCFTRRAPADFTAARDLGEPGFELEERIGDRLHAARSAVGFLALQGRFPSPLAGDAQLRSRELGLALGTESIALRFEGLALGAFGLHPGLRGLFLGPSPLAVGRRACQLVAAIAAAIATRIIAAAATPARCRPMNLRARYVVLSVCARTGSPHKWRLRSSLNVSTEP